MKAIPLGQAERQSRRPTVEGAMDAWLKSDGPIHAPSLAHKPIPPREWAVEGLVPLRAVTLFSGDGGIGKSTLALQLACCTVLGRQWLGRNVRQGRAVVVSNEDDEAELHRRLAGICGGEDWDLADLDGLELFDRVGRDSAVMHRGEGFGVWDDSPWWIRFSNWVRDFGPGLVVLDSLYDFYGTASQLDMGTARMFMGKLREVAHDAGCAIMVLWHPSKSGLESRDGTSGNVAFRNASRSMLYLERDKDADDDAPLLLRTKKQNYGPAADDVRVEWESGRFVLAGHDPVPTGFFAGVERRSAERAFLECLDVLGKRGVKVNAAKRTATYAPREMTGMRQAGGFKFADLERAMRDMLDTGALEVREDGPPSKRRSYIALASKK